MEEIQFIEKGESKDCLLLIHGFCSGPEDWDDQIKFFCADFNILSTYPKRTRRKQLQKQTNEY